MADLFKLSIEKTSLDALNERERVIVIAGGKALNELNIATKYMKFCTNGIRDGTDHGPEQAAAFSMLSFFMRILAGHVLEAYEFFRKNVRMKELPEALGTDARVRSDIKALNTYFGRANIISEIRNKFSFHTDPVPMLKDWNTSRPASRMRCGWGASSKVTPYFMARK